MKINFQNPRAKFRIPNVGSLYAAVLLTKKPRIYLGNSSLCSVVCYYAKTNRFEAVLKKDFEVDAMEITFDEQLIFVSGVDSKIYAISTLTHQTRYILKNPSFIIFGLQILNSANFLFCVDNEKVRLWDLKTKKIIKSISGLQSSEKRCLCLSKNQNSLYGTSGDENLGFIKLKKGCRFTFLKSRKNYYRCHTLNNRETRLFSGSFESILLCSDLRSLKKLFHKNFDLSYITCIRAKDNRIFVTTFNKVVFILADSPKFKVLYCWKEIGDLFHLAFGRDKLLIGGCRTEDVKVYNLADLI